MRCGSLSPVSQNLMLWWIWYAEIIPGHHDSLPQWDEWLSVQWMLFMPILTRFSTLSPITSLQTNWWNMDYMNGYWGGLKSGWSAGIQELWSVACSPSLGQSLVVHPRGWCWGWFNFFINNLQDESEDTLGKLQKQHMVVVPFRGTSGGWRYGSTEISQCLRGSVMSWTWRRINSDRSMDWETISQMENNSAEKDLNVLVHNKLTINSNLASWQRCQKHPGLHYGEHCQQVQGGDPTL